MKFLAVICVVLVVSGWGCGVQPSDKPEIHKVKITVDNKAKKTEIPKVRAKRLDTIEFTAEAGPVTIIIPTADFVVESSPAGTQDKVRGLTILELEKDQSAVLFVPDEFPLNRHYTDKKRHIWYSVICGIRSDAYPGEDDSPPRIIIRKR